MSHADPRQVNPLVTLARIGQLVWLDDISRGMIVSGELERMVAADGLAGITSNPTIFEHAIAQTEEYDDALGELRRRRASAALAYETLVLEDIRRAADVFLPLFTTSGGEAGFVSLEVSPHLARDTEGSIKEARRFWEAVDRPNVLIKIPGTKEGLPTLTQLIAEGINVNVTLIFSVSRYRDVAQAYLAGLLRRTHGDLPVRHIRSVASFFLSRIDAAVDRRLRSLAGGEALAGKTAVSAAKIAYRAFTTLTRSEPWLSLAAQGAAPQKLLWASTGTKDPAYSDIKYVAELAGPDTIVTLPKKTLEAFRDHGRAEPVLDRNLDLAAANLDRLGELGIDLEEVANELEEQGIRLFQAAFSSLHTALHTRLAAT